jgi:hypothetical protein
MRYNSINNPIFMVSRLASKRKLLCSEFEEDIDRELEWNQRNLYEKWKGRMGFYLEKSLDVQNLQIIDY